MNLIGITTYLLPSNRNLHAWRSSRRRLVLAAVLVLLLSLSVSAVGHADEDELQQTIDPNQQQGNGQVVLEAGHVDFGPTLATGRWKLQIHDDTGDISYWRNPSDVVMHVNDKSIMNMPDNSLYSFIGEPAGTRLWVIPQTQNPDVVWVGWNTQEPGVMQELEQGMTLSLQDVQGPGGLDVYLESGNLGKPELIWTNKNPYPQDSWIAVNAHTHVNWVFHKEGVYHVKLKVSGNLKNGKEVSDTDSLIFAVGNSTDPQTAFVTNGRGGDGLSDEQVRKSDENVRKRTAAQQMQNQRSKEESNRRNREQAVLLTGIVVASIVFAALAIVVMVLIKGRRDKRDALQEAQVLFQNSHPGDEAVSKENKRSESTEGARASNEEDGGLSRTGSEG